MTWALIYLTQWPRIVQDFFAVTGLFAIFLLLCLSGCATRAVTECADGLNIDASLTTNHLPRKANSWLPISLNEISHTSASTSSLSQRARLLPKWSFPCHPITTSLKSFLRTKLPSASIWIPASKLLQNSSVGRVAATNHSSAGDLSSASNDFSNTNITPAFSGRVFSSGLARGSPEEYGGEQTAECGGAL
jgi:hypothetical protein